MQYIAMVKQKVVILKHGLQYSCMDCNILAMYTVTV